MSDGSIVCNNMPTLPESNRDGYPRDVGDETSSELPNDRKLFIIGNNNI